MIVHVLGGDGEIPRERREVTIKKDTASRKRKKGDQKCCNNNVIKI